MSQKLGWTKVTGYWCTLPAITTVESTSSACRAFKTKLRGLSWGVCQHFGNHFYENLGSISDELGSRFSW